MASYSNKAWIARISLDVIAFGISLGIAHFLDWETKDLIWSLWLCSLVMGHLSLLSAIAGRIYSVAYVARQTGFTEKKRMRVIRRASADGLAILIFFSFHFGGCLAVLSAILQQFFPVAGMPDEMVFFYAFVIPPYLWLLVFRNIAGPYGLLLIPAIIAERRRVFLSLTKAVESVRAGSVPESTVEDIIKGKTVEKNHPLGPAMLKPYASVVRMIIVIFFLALHLPAKSDSFLVYAVVYLIYFFPWRETVRLTIAASNTRHPDDCRHT